MIAYKLGKNLYLNITNRCSSNCSFCLRNLGPGVGGYKLWLDREPTVEEIIKAVGDPSGYEQVVFCGYGEPLMRLDVVLEVSRYLKQKGAYVRIDTNGQANLIHGKNIVPLLKGLVDAVSISLNAESPQKYDKLCRSEFGEKAYESILDFAKECVKYIPKVILSVVDLPGIDIEKCRHIARDIGAELRVRPYLK
ncbi:MAG: hypothetical protein PWQ82_396 [Thermosediminibacterales bacterium]|nr:hypothetical protein [Thermosediminibacterales bacterium]